MNTWQSNFIILLLVASCQLYIVGVDAAAIPTNNLAPAVIETAVNPEDASTNPNYDYDGSVPSQIDSNTLLSPHHHTFEPAGTGNQ